MINHASGLETGSLAPDSTSWSVYIVRCRDGTLYTGIAREVSRRLADHEQASGRGAKYLRGRGPLRLVFEAVVGSRSLALRIERRIKRLRRPQKEKLISGDRQMEHLLATTRVGE